MYSIMVQMQAVTIRNAADDGDTGSIRINANSGIIIHTDAGVGFRGATSLFITPIVSQGSNMKLIAEQIQEVEYILEEKEDGKKDMKISGIFMQADMKNRNGRVYPMRTSKEVKRYNKEFVAEGPVRGTWTS